MTSQPKPPLEMGATYRVDWDDCCTTGHFTGVFKGVRQPGFSDGSGDPETDCDAVVFSTGEVTDGWNAQYQKVDPQPAMGEVFEVLESIQAHGMGWPDPPPKSHGLFATSQAALRYRSGLANGPMKILATRTVRREVTG